MKKGTDNSDSELLKRAVELAMKGIEKGGGPFGAVITFNGKIISEAYNEVVYTGDPTAHAEILAIRKASEAIGSHILDNCTLYASCEPCPMCLGAIYWSGIHEVIYAADRIDAEKAGFGDKLFYEEIQKDPQNRTIRFKRIKGVSGKEPFVKWDNYEGKVRY
jgi:guanine deaminase